MITPVLSRLRRRSAVRAGALAGVGALAIIGLVAQPASAATSVRTLISSTGSGKVVTLASGTYAFSDFDSNLHGLDLRGKGGLTGAGMSKTIVQMNKYSSSKARSVPTASGTVNQLFLLYTSGTPAIGHLTLQGTSQGHNYNGLMLASTTNARLTNLKIAAIPGTDHVNPGETFGIDENRGTGSVYSGVEVDGAGIAAAGVGVNNSSSITVASSSFHNNVYSAGITFYQSSGIKLTDVNSSYNKTGVNLERTTGTTTITRPVFTGDRADVHISNDRASTVVNIYDPKYSGTKLKVQLNATYMGSSNKQKKSDVHVYVGGKDVTSSVVQWMN